MNIPIEKQKVFIEEFEEIRPDYIEFADLLNQILNKAAEKFGFLVLVQARAKTVSSFAGKIISKDKYKNPLVDMTDLCGARVIVHFQSHVERICSFIKENFEIDEINSLDAKSRLHVNEFGYRSIHYIITPKKDFILEIPIDPKFKTKKAEIQVRTLAEHVWADISHDRIYKTSLNIPEDWRRQAARLSAILEDADIDFSKMATEIDSLTRVFELQHEKSKAKNEIEKLNTLIAVQENNPDECASNVLKLSAIYRAMDQFKEAAEKIEPWLDKRVSLFNQAKLRVEYGMVLSLQNSCNVLSSGYIDGRKAIKQGLRLIDDLPKEIKKENQEQLSYLYYRYGKLLQKNEEEAEEMHRYFSKAHYLMSGNPLYLVALMESVVLSNSDRAKYSVGLFKSSISEAIPRLMELVEIGIDKVPALFALGRCHFFSGNKTACILAYTSAVETIRNEKYLISQSTIEAEIALAGRLERFDPDLAKQIQLYLSIALSLLPSNTNKTNCRCHLELFNIHKGPFKTPVVIVAGGASCMAADKSDDYREHIRELMHNFNGTIISGGTTAGIPGLVGEVKSEMQKTAPVEFDLIAYLPETLPDEAVKSMAYDHFYETESADFSALDIFVCWSDLITNGINPKDVVLIGIDGGEIAGMEYRIALSLGAKVGLVTYSGRAVSDFLQDSTWKNHPGLLPLPNDPITVWALVNQTAETILNPDEIETLAPLVHEFYRKERLADFNPNPKTEDINKYKVIMPWEKLATSLKDSNMKQVAFYEHILQRVNLSIRKSDNPTVLNIKASLDPKDYELLAKLEHARWNAERLLEGWRYGPSKDITAKLNPCIVAWDNLDDDTKKYDFDPVDNIPKMLERIGYEVYRVE